MIAAIYARKSTENLAPAGFGEPADGD